MSKDFTFMPQDSMANNNSIYKPNSFNIGSEDDNLMQWKQPSTFEKNIGKEYTKADSGFDMSVTDGVKVATGLGNLWLGYKNYQAVNEQNALARESFEFNKDMSTKNFDIAKEDRELALLASATMAEDLRVASEEAKRKNNK